MTFLRMSLNMTISSVVIGRKSKSPDIGEIFGDRSIFL